VIDMNQKIASVFLVGAMKAGTSTIAKLLGQQRGVFLSPVKEPNFFKSRQQSPPYTGPVSDVEQWTNWTWTKNDYHRLFSDAADEQLILDATTSYLVNPETPAMVHEYCPDAKIIVCLRNPVQRAVSAFNYMSAGAGDPCVDMKSAIEHEIAGGRDDWLFPWRYLHGGKYDEHLANWLAVFPAEHILVLDFETLISDPKISIAIVCDHLGIDFSSDLVANNPENATTIPGPINALIRRLLINPGAWKSALKPLLPYRFRHALKRDTLKTLRKIGAPPGRIEDSIRVRLEDYYLPHIVKTEDILRTRFGIPDRQNSAVQWRAQIELNRKSIVSQQ
jgi:hypothetical protein